MLRKRKIKSLKVLYSKETPIKTKDGVYKFVAEKLGLEREAHSNQ